MSAAHVAAGVADLGGVGLIADLVDMHVGGECIRIKDHREVCRHRIARGVLKPIDSKRVQDVWRDGDVAFWVLIPSAALTQVKVDDKTTCSAVYIVRALALWFSNFRSNMRRESMGQSVIRTSRG